MKQEKINSYMRLHELSNSNKKMLEIAGKGICMNCGYMGSEFDYLEDDAAICKECNVDMVIPDTSTVKFRSKMYKQWLT